MMNGSQGIVPTMDVSGNNRDGFFGGDGAWLLVILALLFSNGGFGGFGGFGVGAMGYEYPWIANGQQDIIANTNNGFDTLHLSNQIEGVRDGVYGISNQICSSTGNIVNALNSGFANAEIAANARQVADMNQSFNNTVSMLNGFNNLGSQLSTCCCENRLATCQTQNIVQNEGNATRFADANNTRDIITNATANTQAILDKLCQLELDAKNDKISDLQREVLMKDLQASQVAQTADLRANNATVANQLVSELRSCPIPAQPVYGNTPIFECNRNNGCGCGNYYNVM